MQHYADPDPRYSQIMRIRIRITGLKRDFCIAFTTVPVCARYTVEDENKPYITTLKTYFLIHLSQIRTRGA